MLILLSCIREKKQSTSKHLYMKKIVKKEPTIPGYTPFEYLLVLMPHEELRNRIAGVKKEFSEKYKTNAFRSLGSYLTLVKFSQFQLMEERLINRLKTIAMSHAAFKVELKGFSSYPCHSIYIPVTSRLQITELMKDLRAAGRLMKQGDKDPHYLEDPQFTIANKLLPWQYEQGWLEYKNRSFTAKFIADHLLLLRRRTGEKRYEVIQRFEFMNLPVTSRQGELFWAGIM